MASLYQNIKINKQFLELTKHFSHEQHQILIQSLAHQGTFNKPLTPKQASNLSKYFVGLSKEEGTWQYLWKSVSTGKHSKTNCWRIHSTNNFAVRRYLIDALSHSWSNKPFLAAPVCHK